MIEKEYRIGELDVVTFLYEGTLELHIYQEDVCNVLTGRGFFTTMSEIRQVLSSVEGVENIGIFACDDKRQRVFTRYLKRIAEVEPLKVIDFEGDETDVFKIIKWL